MGHTLTPIPFLIIDDTKIDIHTASAGFESFMGIKKLSDLGSLRGSFYRIDDADELEFRTPDGQFLQMEVL